MPFRPSHRPPDLERAARVLGARQGDADEVLPGPALVGEPDPDGPEELRQGADGGWVPGPPGPVSAPGSVATVGAAVRRLTARATDDEVSRLDADLRRARRPGLLTVPDELRSGRRAVSSAALVALLALVVAVGCAFVLRVLWAERSSTVPGEAPGPSRSVQVVGGTAAAVPSTGPASTASGAPTARDAAGPGAEIVVHVVGQVLRPGLVRLRAGARVADAIKQAGGARAGADLGALNLARPLTDGEQIRVPRPGEAVTAAGAGSGGGSGGPTAGGGAGASSAAPVSLNAADASALDALPGVGPVLAQRIIDWRAEHGRFTSVDELGEVSGIGDKLLERLRPLVTL